jgi:DNA-binding transcriptional ArsR family regulator
MPDIEPGVTFEGVAGRHDVLQVLADPTCRTILQRLSDQAMTAGELADTLGVPISTLYRKLDALIATPLVETTLRLQSDGHHTREYRCAFDRVSVRMAPRHDRSLQVRVS